MQVSTRAIIEIEKPREAVFEYATAAENIPKYFRGAGPVPAVDRAHVLGNGPPKKGAVRRVVTANGMPLDEEITAHEPPRTHNYTIKGLRGPLRLLAKRIDAEMIFSPLGNGTRVTWTYNIVLTSPLALGPASLLARVFVKRALEQGLAHIKAAV